MKRLGLLGSLALATGILLALPTLASLPPTHDDADATTPLASSTTGTTFLDAVSADGTTVALHGNTVGGPGPSLQPVSDGGAITIAAQAPLSLGALLSSTRFTGNGSSGDAGDVTVRTSTQLGHGLGVVGHRPAVALGLTVAILPRAKGFLMGIIWATRAPGSERD